MLAPADDARIKILERKVDALERELQKRPTLSEKGGNSCTKNK